MDAEEKPVEPVAMTRQLLSAINETLLTPHSQHAAISQPRVIATQSGSLGAGGDHTLYAANVYDPQAHGIYYKGHENASGEVLDIGSAGMYNDNPSLVYHSGYGYNPQLPYGPYSPVTSPLPSVGGDAQLYSPQPYSFSGAPYFQQLGPPNIPYITSPTQVSQPEVNSLLSLGQQVDGMLYGPRPGYPSPLGSFGTGNFPGNPGTLRDSRQGFDALRCSGIWSDWPKSSDRHSSFTPLPPSVSPQTVATLGSFGQNLGMASQQPRSLCGFGSDSDSYSGGYLRSGFNLGSFRSASLSSVGTNSRGWHALDNGGRYGRGSGALCSCSGTVDILSEQNRGPRASKLKSQAADDNSPSADGCKHSSTTAKIPDERYNRPDFITDHKDAKFFIIKSYSEDNVHKSIKYGVWASTHNGNRKVDAAYREAEEKRSTCPIFLLFSVNASAQFCGVAEMVGHVDFDRSVDYWQQDKWSGQFPVKWHIIKDVPNSQFRHIVLENNDKKPVTNSRDTQEVKLGQGIEMLIIFKNYKTDMSILDDFTFYEDRQIAMQERKSRQQADFVDVGAGGSENRNVATLSNDIIRQMSKSFAQVVAMEDCAKEGSGVDRAASTLDGSIGTRVKLDEAISSTAMSSAQSS
ncbi:hypothetical protein RJ639_007637 [Escallonia herrerae]|uniref:YTH domain-containing family protein n=1 Tax=Escallonia herrerae TaxID=1293975 RepID=A0AA89AYB0_9ASTE|nr:hypothetical protein RJ639_007637 [Escallonia herrerae]